MWFESTSQSLFEATMLKSVTLTNGKPITGDRLGFSALQDAMPEVGYACEVCPVRKFCGDNNEFDCMVHGMFTGFYATDESGIHPPTDIDEALRQAGAA